MPLRPDISDKLVHFTSGPDWSDAFDRLQKIVSEARLVGSNGAIRGGHSCVCFSEAPLSALQHGLMNASAHSRYSPFGIIFDKAWLYGRGARPVLYQTDAECGLLPPHLQWRHVRYEPPAIDFTWEREWRWLGDALTFDPCVAGIVVPDQGWAKRLLEAHEWDQAYRVMEYSQIMDEQLAEMYREDYPWRISPLR